MIKWPLPHASTKEHDVKHIHRGEEGIGGD